MKVLWRLATATVAASIALTLLAGVAAAVRPERGCSDEFEAIPILDFRAYMNSTAFYDSLPPEGQALAPDFLAIINTQAWLDGAGGIDANGDGVLCLKQKTSTSGHFWGWLWNAVDNTKNPDFN